VFVALMYVVAFELGLGPIPWLIVAEISPTSHRSLIMGIASAINSISSMLVGFEFNPVEHLLHSSVFFIFAVTLSISGIFVFMVVHETKGMDPNDVFERLNGSKNNMLRSKQTSIQGGVGRWREVLLHQDNALGEEIED
jgi:hypothetical protein